jgi:hypothetical protein
VTDDQNEVCQGLLRGEVAQVFRVLRQDNQQKRSVIGRYLVFKLQVAYSVMQCTYATNKVFTFKT